MKTSKKHSPLIGLFWVHSSKIYVHKTTIAEGQAYGKLIVCPLAHYDVWRRIQKQNPKFKGMEYEDVPRGRVSADISQKPRKYRIVMTSTLHAPTTMRAIAKAFVLPIGQCEFIKDEHYEIP